MIVAEKDYIMVRRDAKNAGVLNKKWGPGSFMIVDVMKNELVD